MSNAFDMSRAIVIVRVGSFLRLKPVVMILFMRSNAVVVKCCFRKPCWCLGKHVFSTISGNMVFSISLAIGSERSAMGQYDVPMEGSLFGFRIGMIFATFKMAGIVLVHRDKFRVCVSRAIARGPQVF